MSRRACYFFICFMLTWRRYAWRANVIAAHSTLAFFNSIQYERLLSFLVNYFYILFFRNNNNTFFGVLDNLLSWLTLRRFDSLSPMEIVWVIYFIEPQIELGWVFFGDLSNHFISARLSKSCHHLFLISFLYKL